MTNVHRLACTSGSIALLCTATQAEPGRGAAIETPQSGWAIVHCGLSRGVLYVTYIDRPAPRRNCRSTPVAAADKQDSQGAHLRGPGARFVGLPTWHCIVAE